ncbi:1,2-phenylacetyl-CoA epoxidase subunit PaaC [Effusibacillus consociatus]|uniref:1,2-phenylacetyl-CoA epoxidase subunit PaaC n=1 Tax=Effusibacillus consociatus TaxID=1117041 RepID=A0ABV9QAS0_9BACL
MVSSLRIESAEQAMQNPEYLTALKELLFQVADDDFILAHRGSEWLGLAPHIEEDVAFSSMSQDMMGHAVMFYEMLEALGAGKADDLAQLRKPEDFRNAVLVERMNGTGDYIEEPHYDWAYAIARCYFYGLFKEVRSESLANSSYLPLAQVSRKTMTEHRYHMIHWQVWMSQLANSTEEARNRLANALGKVWDDIGGLFILGPLAASIVKHGLIEGEELLTQRWLEKAKKAFDTFGLTWIGKPKTPELNGRAGQHTQELADAIDTLSEVYRLDPAANW